MAKIKIALPPGLAAIGGSAFKREAERKDET